MRLWALAGMISPLLACTAVVSGGTNDAGAPPDAGAPSRDAGPGADAGPGGTDAGPGTPDAGVADGGPRDAGAADSGEVQPIGPSGSWTLAFDEEFNGTALDPSKWSSGWYSGPTSPGQGDTQAITTSQQAGTYYGPAGLLFPGDGALHLRLSNPVDAAPGTGFSTRESGMINTAGLWSLNPGSAGYAGAGATIDGTQAIEIRARLAGPTSQGAAYWPAFWMTNAGNYNGGGQSYTEEVDLLEGLGNGSLGGNLEFHLHAASEYGGGILVVPQTEQSTDFSLAYHTYTFTFSTTQIQCWCDGTLVPDVSPTASQVSAQWTVPQYLMLGFQATSGAVLPTSATGTPNDLMIDYVRIWTQG